MSERRGAGRRNVQSSARSEKAAKPSVQPALPHPDNVSFFFIDTTEHGSSKKIRPTSTQATGIWITPCRVVVQNILDLPSPSEGEGKSKTSGEGESKSSVAFRNCTTYHFACVGLTDARRRRRCRWRSSAATTRRLEISCKRPLRLISEHTTATVSRIRYREQDANPTV